MVGLVMNNRSTNPYEPPTNEHENTFVIFRGISWIVFDLSG